MSASRGFIEGCMSSASSLAVIRLAENARDSRSGEGSAKIGRETMGG